MWSGGDGAGDTRQQRWRGYGVAGGNGGGCAAKGACAVVVRCKGGMGGGGWRQDTRARGTGKWWGQ